VRPQDDPRASAQGMTGQSTPERTLVNVLLALGPYLPDLILIGGWVPYLFHRYGGFPGWIQRPSLTTEADILLPTNLDSSTRPDLASVLRDSGFSPEGGGSSAAVWVRDASRGERIEFLIGHKVPARHQGRSTSVPGQRGIDAIAFGSLGILERHTAMLLLPLANAIAVTSPSLVQPTVLPVRVPCLGAFVINKAATFPLRLGTGSATTRLEAAKDILYLRDVFAAGRSVVGAVRDDLKRIVATDSLAETLVRRGASNLSGLSRGALRSLLDQVAMMRHERELAVTTAAARADAEGYLHDASAMLEKLAKQE
jgi:hypothetical protein